MHEADALTIRLGRQLRPQAVTLVYDMGHPFVRIDIGRKSPLSPGPMEVSAQHSKAECATITSGRLNNEQT